MPAYGMPPDAEDIAVLRICFREGFSRDMADIVMRDLRAAAEHFEKQPGHRPKLVEKRGKTHDHC